MLAEHIAWQLVAEVAAQPLLIGVMPVAAVQVEGNPADAALGEREFQIRVVAHRRPPQQVLCAHRRHLSRQDDQVVDRRVRRHADRAEARPDVQAHHYVLLGKGAKHRPPILVVVVARKPFQVRQFRHRDRATALGGDAANFGTHRLGVPRRQDRDRDESVRVTARPFVDVPVVVGRDHHQRHLLAVHVEVPGGESRECREAHRREDAVSVHVPDAFVHVVHAGAHLGEAGRVAPPLLGRPRHHRVQPAHALRPALIHPLVDALVVGDDDRRLGLVLGGHVVEEHVRRLHDVVVDAHQDQVVGLHSSVVPSTGVTVSALSDRGLAQPANDQLDVPRVIELRRGGRALGGSYLYEGEGLITGWHSHEVHQIEYAIGGVVDVETASAHYLLPPQQAAWIPAGLEHQATMAPGVRTVAVMFDAQMIPTGGDRARILAVSPLIREMMIYALRWPIDRPQGDDISDAFFRTLADLVVEALDHEAPLSLPTSEHPIVDAAMAFTKKHLQSVSADRVSRAVAVSERTLRRLFHDELGLSWRTYLLHARMLRAMALLASPGQTVQETSTAVGFDSLSSFTRAFTQFSGETPSTYRKRVAGEAV